MSRPPDIEYKVERIDFLPRIVLAKYLSNDIAIDLAPQRDRSLAVPMLTRPVKLLLYAKHEDMNYTK